MWTSGPNEICQIWRLVYWWTDDLYVKTGIADCKSALRMNVSALTTGKKIIMTCESGERESKES